MHPDAPNNQAAQFKGTLTQLALESIGQHLRAQFDYVIRERLPDALVDQMALLARTRG